MKNGRLISFFAAIAMLVLAMLFQYYKEDDSSFEAARRQSGDQFFETELGSTRYRTYGEKNQPTIVLIHGFNGFLETWDKNIEPLVKSGHRVITYDFWGRGLTSRPPVNLSLPVFREQLATLIHHLNAKKVILMGSSFGCVIAADYALNYPGGVEKMVIVGPAGWPSTNDSQWIKLPIIGDLAFHYFGIQILRPKVDAYFYAADSAPWALATWDKYSNYPGFTRTALSTLRYSPVTDYTDGWRQLGAQSLPTLFIWGKQDVSFPYSNRGKVSILMPQAQVLGIDHAAHWVNIEKPAEVNAAVSAFLRN